MQTPGTIIMLNGTTSSGKSATLSALQRQLAAPYLEAGIDKFLYMLPERWLEWPEWAEVLGDADRAGPVGQQLFSGMHHAIAALARQSNNVLADHVLLDPCWVAECAALYADLPAYLIGLRCPQAVLDAREIARGDRLPGQAKKQNRVAHAHTIYDIEIDTSAHPPDACAAQIIHHISTKPPRAWRALHTTRSGV